jgi:glycosyltransferase involved in cell wall biosynthesis
MQIAFFLQSRDFGGAEKFATELLSELQQRHHQTTLFTSNQTVLDDQSNIHKKNIPIYLDFAGNHKGLLKSLLLLPLAFVYYFFTLAKIKRTAAKTIIIASGFSEKIILASLCKLLNLKTVFIEYGPLRPLFEKLHGIPGFLYRLIKNYPQKIIVSSMKTKKALRGIFPKEKLVLIPCGTNPPSTHSNQLKPTAPPFLVCIGRLQKDKGQDLAIAAFQQLQIEFPELQLLIIGKGEAAVKLHALAANNAQIIFLDKVDDHWHYLRQATVVLCPSVWNLEGFGLVVTEAMAVGQAIVAFDRPPYNELLTHRHNALLAQDRSITDLARQIRILLENSKLRQQLGHIAQQDFMKKYHITQAAQRYEQLLEQL